MLSNIGRALIHIILKTSINRKCYVYLVGCYVITINQCGAIVDIDRKNILVHNKLLSFVLLFSGKTPP